jgi:hypothetical protein
MRIKPELVEVVKKRSPRRADPRGNIGTTRVDIEHVEQKSLAARYKTEDREFEILIDERVSWRPQPGPDAAGLFHDGRRRLTHDPICQCGNQRRNSPGFVEAGGSRPSRSRVASFHGCDLRNAIGRNGIDRSAQGLAKMASEECFVENTLAKAIPVTRHVFLSGSKIATWTRGPAGPAL